MGLVTIKIRFVIGYKCEICKMDELIELMSSLQISTDEHDEPMDTSE